MYTKHETYRKKYQKVKCPYCQANSNITNTLNTMQYRVCKNQHHFVYDSDLAAIVQRAKDCNDYIVSPIPKIKKLQLSYKEGDKTVKIHGSKED